MSTIAVFVSHLEPMAVGSVNKETLANQLDEVTTSNLISNTNTTDKISQAENELGSKLRVAGVYVLSSMLIIVFLINHLL